VNPDQYIKALGEVIRNKHTKLGYSQESFAAEVGLHRTYIGQVERGEKNLTIRNLVKIANTLKIKPSNLFINSEK
jgi:transcriptional regulator with XRE-family HTH domain